MGSMGRNSFVRVVLVLLVVFFCAISVLAEQETTIELYNRQAEDNTAFNVTNMFPGDKVTKDYRVVVSYHDEVIVHYHADIREGYEKLAEVLKVNITLNGQFVYDGLLRDMASSIDYSLNSEEATTSELYYQITAYLDTSVGNEYQNKELVADFKWWVEDDSHLDPLPDTGDKFNLALCCTVAVGSLVLALIVIRKKRESS